MKKSNFFGERRELINETFGILKSLKDHVGKTSQITATIPRIDNLIMAQKDNFRQANQNKRNRQIGHLTKQKLLNFMNVKSENILKMFAKTFDTYQRSLDYLNERIDISSVGLTKGIENSKNDMEGALNDKRLELENQLKSLVEDYKMSLETMKSQVNSTTSQLNKKYDSEVERLTEHFEKIIAQREETFSLTSTSLSKAQADLEEATRQRETELRAVISKNNDVLETHSESMMSKLVGDEEKAAKLEKEFNEVFKTHSTLGPELDRQWREKSKKMKEEFQDEDDLFDMDIKQKKLMIEDLTRQLNEANSTYQAQKVEIDEKMQATVKIYEKNIQKIINDRPIEVEKAKKKAINEHKAKEQKMLDMLQNMRSKIEADAEQMRSKINDKTSAHADKVHALEEEQRKVLAELEAEKQKYKDEMEEIKATWDSDKKKIIDGFEKDISDAKNKSATEQKYFEAKRDALQKELDNIIVENSKIEQEAAKNTNYGEINEYDKKLRQAESDLESKMRNEVNDKIKKAVDEKMLELKKQHDAEREKLLAQVKLLEDKERDVCDSIANYNADDVLPLPSKIYKTEVRVSAQSTGRKIAAIPAYRDPIPTNDPGSISTSRKSTGRAIPSFATQQFLDSQIDKWREDYLNDTKTLKQEQSYAMKQLEESKKEFQSAVKQISSLKEKLVRATEEYAVTIKESETKNESELKELQCVIEEKEKTISELELQFEENERELKRRARQIEAVEDKLTHLKEHLDEEKEKIRKKIKEEYQPLIFQEQKKSDEKEVKLRNLKNELEINLEFMKNDLFVVESANAGMEESLRNETREMVEKLKNELNAQCQQAEEEFSQRLADQEIAKQDRIAKRLEEYKKEEEDKVDQFNEEMNAIEEKQQEDIQSINDYCINVLSENAEKKKEITELANVQCPKCNILQKNVKHLEKEIVQLQIQCRNANLENANNLSLYKTFKQQPKLPPIPQ